MARFRFLGNIPVSYIEHFGPTTAIKLQRTNGSVQVVTPPNQAAEFVVGADIGIDITDARALRFMRIDPRFEEIV